MNEWAATLTTSQLIREIVRAEMAMARADEGEGMSDFDRREVQMRRAACAFELDCRVPGRP